MKGSSLSFLDLAKKKNPNEAIILEIGCFSFIQHDNVLHPVSIRMI